MKYDGHWGTWYQTIFISGRISVTMVQRKMKKKKKKKNSEATLRTNCKH